MKGRIGDIDHEVFLGDGLYVTYDGHYVRLRAPRPPGDDHVVYLDPGVLNAFMNYLDCCMDKGGPHGHS